MPSHNGQQQEPKNIASYWETACQIVLLSTLPSVKPFACQWRLLGHWPPHATSFHKFMMQKIKKTTIVIIFSPMHTQHCSRTILCTRRVVVHVIRIANAPKRTLRGMNAAASPPIDNVIATEITAYFIDRAVSLTKQCLGIALITSRFVGKVFS